MQHNTDYCEMNIDRLAHFLQKYGEVSKVYVAAFNRSGEQLTDFAKDDIEKEYESDNDEKAYYNRLELLDLLVNTEAPIDAIDIESYISDEEAKKLLIEAQLINELKIQEDKSVNT